MVLNTPPTSKPAIYDTFDGFIAAAQRHFPGIANPNNPYSNVVGNVYSSYVSCGVSMLSGINGSTPEQIVNKVLKERSVNDYKKIREAFVVFSDTDNAAGGNELCRYIKDNKLGAILEMGPRMNPNTGNMIKIWVWAPPHISLSPADSAMPIYGKIMRKSAYGVAYEDDPRFHSNTSDSPAREG